MRAPITTHIATPTLLDTLSSRFNGQILIPFLDAVSVIGYNHQTARNELARGVFPLPTLLQGSRRFVSIYELAGYVERLCAPRAEPTVKKKRGRPTKATEIAARRANVAT